MKKVLKISESQYKKLLLFEQSNKGGFKMDYKKLKNNPSTEYIAAVIKNSKGKWNDEEAWVQSAFEAIKDYDTYKEVYQILKVDPYKFVKSFMDTDEDYHNNGNTIDKLYYKIYNLKGAGTPFKMDYKKLKNNPSPKYIADVLENSKGGLGDDKEAWAQSAFESIKNQETYNKVQEFLGGNDPYEFVKSFMSTNIDYHDNGNIIDKLYDNLFPENPRFHFICNDLSTRNSKYGEIPKHGEKCYSCGKELRQFCSSKGMVATLETMKGSDWDEFFGKRKNSKYELPMYGGHWDNDEYTYCVCAKGETKKSGNNYYFLEDRNTYISPAPSEYELKLIEQQRSKYLDLIQKNVNSSLIEAFDCSVYRKDGDEKSWWKYQQCLTENASMAVSVVPVIGTAVSAILDIVNAVSYLSSAFLGSSEEIQSEDFLMAAISLGSVLPVFGEVKSVVNLGSKEVKATQKILKELKEEGLEASISAGKFDDSFSMINNAYTKHTSGLNSLQKKNVNKTLENIKKISEGEINNQIKVLKDVLEGYKKEGLTQHHLHKLLKNKNFIDLLNKNGNDLSKTLKSQQGKEMITNIIVQLGVGVGIVNWQKIGDSLKKEIEKRNFIYEKEKTLTSKLFLLEYLSFDWYEILENDVVIVNAMSEEYDQDKDLFGDDEKVKELFKKIFNKIKNESVVKNKKIKITENQYNRLFNEQFDYEKLKSDVNKSLEKGKEKLDSEVDELKRGTPKYRFIKSLIEVKILYQNKKGFNIKTDEYKDSQGYWRFEFYDTSYDGIKIGFQIIDNNEYKTSGYVNFQYDGKQMGWGFYNKAETNPLWMMIKKYFGRDYSSDTTIMEGFKKFKKDINITTKTGKGIIDFEKLYEGIENVDITKEVNKSKVEEIRDFLKQKNDCKLFTNTDKTELLYKFFNIDDNRFNSPLIGEDPMKKLKDEVIAEITKINKECWNQK